jgi:hypothetical protein
MAANPQPERPIPGYRAMGRGAQIVLLAEHDTERGIRVRTERLRAFIEVVRCRSYVSAQVIVAEAELTC